MRVVHALGMPGTFSLPLYSMETASLWSRHASRHLRHTRVVMDVVIVNTRWRGKRSRHSQCNPQFYVSAKRPMSVWLLVHALISVNPCKKISANWVTLRSSLAADVDVWGVPWPRLAHAVVGWPSRWLGNPAYFGDGQEIVLHSDSGLSADGNLWKKVETVIHINWNSNKFHSAKR